MFLLRNLSFEYHSGKNVLSDINLEFNEGEFVLLTGANGSGKSTLIKVLTGIAPHHTGGSLTGEAKFKNQSIAEHEPLRFAGTIGLTLQEPENQVTNLTVWEEVTFGPRNLCLAPFQVVEQAIQALSAVNLKEKKDWEVFHLSGGQLQRLSIAALLAMRPEVLILDEPISNLDPFGVHSIVRVLTALKPFVKLIIVASHWLDPFLGLTSRIIVMNDGRISLDIPPNQLEKNTDSLTIFAVETPHSIILRRTLGDNLDKPFKVKEIPSQAKSLGIPKLRADHLGFSFTPGTVALQDISLTLHPRENISVLGHNGAGKTTLGRLITGLLKPTEGALNSQYVRPSLLLQRPSLGFLGKTVTEEVSWGLNLAPTRLEQTLEQFSLMHLKDRSPFTLSGGEQRRLALAVAVAIKPDILILDEPSAGLDATQVKQLTAVLKTELVETTIVYITHDSRVITQNERVLFLQDGRIIYNGSRHNLNSILLHNLGYHLINPTVALAIQTQNENLPMHPSEIEVLT